MAGWIRNCDFLIWIVLASQVVAQEDSAARPPSPSVRQLEYAQRIAMAQRDISHNYIARARRLLELCPQDMRGWEWHYLRRLCKSELKSVQVPQAIDEVLFSPVGSRYVLIGRRRISVRSLPDDKDVFELKGFVRDAAFSHDGQTLAVAGARSVSIVDPIDGTLRKKIELPTLWERERIVCVCLSPNGDRLGVVKFFSDKSNLQRLSELTIWDVDSAQPVREFGAVPASTVHVQFSPDEKLVATGSAGKGGENPHWPGEVRICDLETGKQIQLLQIYDPSFLPDGYFLRDFVFSPDGAHVVTASSGGDVMVWEVSSGKKIHTLNAHKGSARIAFDGSGSRIVSGGKDRSIRVWDAATGAELSSMRGLASPIKTVAFLDDQRIASVGQNIRIWDADSPRAARTYQGDRRGSAVHGIAFSPTSDLLGTASRHVAQIRDVRRGSIRHEVPTGSDGLGPDIAFSADSQLFGTTDRDGGKLWNVETGDLVSKLPDAVNDSDGSIVGIAFDPAGSLVATSGHDQLAIWNQKTGELVRKIEMSRGTSACVVFSPDGKHLVTGHEGHEPVGEVVPGEVNFWDVETGKLKLTITAGGTGIMAISFDPDGRRIAVTVDDRVTMFDTDTGTKLMQLRGHAVSVNDVAFSPDGDRIASCGDDQTIRIWDANSGQELLALRGHDSPAVRVAFSPNGQHLASSAESGEVKVWDATPPSELGLQARVDD